MKPSHLTLETLLFGMIFIIQMEGTDQWKGPGTTPSLENIIIGRCYDYIETVNPSVGNKNCSAIWSAFKSAFVSKDPCSVFPSDYESYINLTFHDIPINKSLFWENNKHLVHRLSDRGNRYMALGDTLMGWLVDNLYFCGTSSDSGFNYDSCPITSECEHNAEESFWRLASVTYAKYSYGEIQILLNGSTPGGAFPVPSFLADFEIPNFQKDKVSSINIWVMDEIDGVNVDSCGKNSTATLESVLSQRGFLYRCYDNYLDKNCSGIWQELVDAVQRKDPCKITEEDYKHLALVAAQTIPCNKTLLWSRTNELVHRYTKATENFITLEDTLLGFMFNGLMWCGKTFRPGMNFKFCPAWNECDHNSISSFWKMTSAAFARVSCGLVNVMLNGSADGDIARKESILKTVEIPNMDPNTISEVRVWVIDDIQGEDKNSCNSKSLLELQHYIEGHKLKYSCIDNYRPVQALQCAENPDHAACNRCNYQ